MTTLIDSRVCHDCGSDEDVQWEENLGRNVCEGCYEDYCEQVFCYQCESWDTRITNAVDVHGFPVSHDEIVTGAFWIAYDGVSRICTECGNEWTYR